MLQNKYICIDLIETEQMRRCIMDLDQNSL